MLPNNLGEHCFCCSQNVAFNKENTDSETAEDSCSRSVLFAASAQYGSSKAFLLSP